MPDGQIIGGSATKSTVFVPANDGTFISAVAKGVPTAAPLVGQKIVSSDIQPYTGNPNDIFAQLTNNARTLLGRMLTEGLSFKIIGFAVGRGGYDPLDPVTSTGVSPGATTLDDQVFPTVGTLETVDLIEYPTTGAISLLCRLESGEAIAGLGELGLWVEIQDSPVVPSEVGDQYLFAIAHTPLQGKTDNHVYLQRLVVAF